MMFCFDNVHAGCVAIDVHDGCVAIDNVQDGCDAIFVEHDYVASLVRGFADLLIAHCARGSSGF